MARRHGWAGDPPRSDEEAVARIVTAAIAVIDDTRADVGIADVARTLGVTRQTVYRYFPNSEVLMEAVAVASVGAFMDRIQARVAGLSDPAEATAEAVAYVLEALPQTPHLGLLLTASHTNRFLPAITSVQALEFGRSMLARFDVDWAAFGYDETARDELLEFVLRTIQSFVADPGDPGRDGPELRRYLRRWVGAAVAAQPVQR